MNPPQKKATRRAGQPTKYHKGAGEKVLEGARLGKTIEMIADEMDVHKDTLYEWAKKHPEFSDAMKRARQAQQVVMQKIGLSGITGKTKGFGQAAWIFWMKAQFGWRENDPIENDPVEELEFI